MKVAIQKKTVLLLNPKKSVVTAKTTAKDAQEQQRNMAKLSYIPGAGPIKLGTTLSTINNLAKKYNLTTENKTVAQLLAEVNELDINTKKDKIKMLVLGKNYSPINPEGVSSFVSNALYVAKVHLLKLINDISITSF